MAESTDVVLCPGCGESADRSATRCGACDEPLLLNGRYLLERVLGSNVGTTYLASDTREDRRVVIKELSYSKLDSWKSEDLFQREIRVLRQLDHPQIPNYVDDFPQGQGKRLRHYLVQQLIEGESLRDEQEHRRYDEAQVLAILDQVLSVLEYLQGLRPPLIHRDLKPSNLMRLEGSDKIALIDFGAVRDLVAPSGDNPTVAGTFGFMAPEQFQGDAYLQTDLYALGVVALNLLSRTRPEKMLSSSMQLAWQEHVTVSEPMARLLGLLLAPEVGDRPKDASAARALLADVQAELQSPTRRKASSAPPSTPSRPAKPTKVTAARASRKSKDAAALRRQWALIGVGVVATMGGVWIFQFFKDLPDRPPEPARAIARATADTPARARPRSARPPRPTPPPAASTKMAIDLDVPQLIRALTAHRWKGTLDGELRFAGNDAQSLRAALHRKDGSATGLLVRPGPSGTLTLVLHQRRGGVTTTYTFSGGLTADHRTLKGSFETKQQSGGQAYDSGGSWWVRAVIAEQPAP